MIDYTPHEIRSLYDFLDTHKESERNPMAKKKLERILEWLSYIHAQADK